MLKESIDELIKLLKVPKEKVANSQMEDEIQNLISKNKFFGIEIDEVLAKDTKNKKKIEDQIMKVKTMFALQMVSKETTKVSVPTAIPSLDFFSKFGPLIEVVTSSGLIQKVTECHKTYIGDKEPTSEGVLKCIREIANSKELEVAFAKIDVKKLTSGLDIMDLMSLSQNFLPNIKKQ